MWAAIRLEQAGTFARSDTGRESTLAQLRLPTCSESSIWYCACGRLAITPITPLMVPNSTVGMWLSSARQRDGTHACQTAGWLGA